MDFLTKIGLSLKFPISRVCERLCLELSVENPELEYLGTWVDLVGYTKEKTPWQKCIWGVATKLFSSRFKPLFPWSLQYVSISNICRDDQTHVFISWCLVTYKRWTGRKKIEKPKIAPFDNAALSTRKHLSLSPISMRDVTFADLKLTVQCLLHIMLSYILQTYKTGLIFHNRHRYSNRSIKK